MPHAKHAEAGGAEEVVKPAMPHLVQVEWLGYSKKETYNLCLTGCSYDIAYEDGAIKDRGNHLPLDRSSGGPHDLAASMMPASAASAIMSLDRLCGSCCV